MALNLYGTKGAKLRGVAFETVILKDPVIVKILSKLKAQGQRRLFNGSSTQFSSLYRDAVAFFRLSHPKPTPHGIRRGGASWHFNLHGQYDRTVEHGRWQTVKAARIYINEASAEEAAKSASSLGQSRLRDAVALLPSLLREVG